MPLTPEQTRRYTRQLFLEEVGREGQERLLAACVRVPGRGVAAEEATIYLAAAGVGRLVLDPTLEARLSDRLHDLNPDVRLGPGAPCIDAGLGSDPDADTRLAGARAALATLVLLTGAAEAA